MATKEEILDAIGEMSVLELSELLKEFEDKFDVTAAAPVAAAAHQLQLVLRMGKLKRKTALMYNLPKQEIRKSK